MKNVKQELEKVMVRDDEMMMAVVVAEGSLVHEMK